MKRWGFGAIRVALGIAILAWLSRSGLIDWSALRGLYARWNLTLLALGVLIVDVMVTSWRLNRLFAARGWHLSLGDATRLNLVGNLFNLFLPSGGGDVVRLYFAAADARGQRTSIATILLFDRLAGVVAILLCPLLFIPFNLDLLRASPVLRTVITVGIVFAATLSVGCGVMMSSTVRSWKPVTALLKRLPMQSYLTLVLDTLGAFRERRWMLLEVLGLSILAHLLSALVISIVLVATGGPLDYPTVAFLALVGFVANSVPLTPSGLGFGEAAFESLFRLAGIEGGAAAMLAWRLLLLSLAPAGLWVFIRGRRWQGLKGENTA